MTAPPVRWAVLAWALACWPLAEWYGRRLLFVPDQLGMGLAPLAAAWLAWRRRGDVAPAAGFGRWLPSALFMLVYAAACARAPMTILALPALAALLFLPGPWRAGALPDAPIAGLLVLGLPGMAMLQFHFGFPLQLAAASLAVPVLRLAGLPVLREGALLMMDGREAGVDTACGGIRMGWAALFLAFTLAGLARLGWWRTAVAAAGCLVLVLLLNAVRVAALFVVETSGLGGRAVLHEGIGVCLFAGLAIGALLGVRLLARRPA